MNNKIAILALAMLGAAAAAQQTTPPSRPIVVTNPAGAPTGKYALDPRHTSIIARVGHAGPTSFSTFRFGTASSALDWVGTDPTQSKISVTVDMTSIATPVANFANELVGDRFLKTATYHDATFVSTAIERTGAATGRIVGNMTFMGVTKPVTIDAVFVGAGKTMRGGDVVGFSGKLRFKRSDFGFTVMSGVISDEIELELDAEFDKVP
jgi:polyisoprenoid-binding protein YceI